MISENHYGSTIVACLEIEGGDAFSRRQRETAAIRAILDKVVGKHTVLVHDKYGAPVLNGWNVSVSHSRKLAVVAFDAYAPVGIDAEEWRPALSDIKRKFLSDNELSIFSDSEQLLKAWTIKEAVYKIVGHEAVDFSHAIAIASDMDKAFCLGRTFRICTFIHKDTVISLAIESRNCELYKYDNKKATF